MLIVLLQRHKAQFKPSHLNAIDSCAERISRIFSHANERPEVPLGVPRFVVIQTLLPLVRLDSGTINLRIVNLRVLPGLLVLMFRSHPRCSIAHTYIRHTFSEILEKARRNRTQSIMSMLLTDDQPQLFHIIELILNSMEGSEHGCGKEVLHMDTSRHLFLELEKIVRVKDLVKTAEFLPLWKSTSKAIKAYESQLDKSQSKTKKQVSALIKAKRRASLAGEC